MKPRLLFAALGVLLLGITLVCVATSSGPRYRAESFIVVRPFTNAVFARSFEAQVIGTIPGVLRLELVPMRSAIPPSMTPGATNGAGIRILAVGATAEGAHCAATNGATRLCVIIH